MTLNEARGVVKRVSAAFTYGTPSVQEHGDALDGIIAAIYQSFTGLNLNPMSEEKAANLLYLAVKDHLLSNENERRATAFLLYLPCKE